jgi:predicted TIM-barrel fold metal-dependent hydrolase
MEIREAAFLGKPVAVPVVDAHTHILGFSKNGWYQAFSSNDEIIALMDCLGIDCIVTAPHSLIIGDIAHANESALSAAAAFPGRIYAYISLRPQQELSGIRQTLAAYSQKECFVGLKFLAGYHGSLRCAEYDYALDFAEECGCPVLCHTWGNNPSMEDVERAVKKRPRLKLMMAHQGGGTAECTNQLVGLMNEYPNLYMETCGSFHNRYSIEDLVELAGEERVIFGSDMINLDPRFDFGRVVFSTLPDSVKKKVLAENYLELLEGSQRGRISLIKYGIG